MLKKIVPFLFLPVLCFVFIPQVFAVSETCNPVITCPPDEDYYANDCYLHIETISDCGSGDGWAFSCDTGCFNSKTGEISNRASSNSFDTSPKYDTPPRVETDVVQRPEEEEEIQQPELNSNVDSDSAVLLPLCPKGKILKSNGEMWLCANDSIGQFSSPLPKVCETGQVIKWNETGWVCANDNMVKSISLLAFGLILLAVLLLLKFF